MRSIFGKWAKRNKSGKTGELKYGRARAVLPKEVLEKVRASKITIQRALTTAVEFKKKLAPKQLELINYARKHGVFIEEPCKYDRIRRMGTFRKQGITLYGLSALQNLPPKKKLIEKMTSSCP